MADDSPEQHAQETLAWEAENGPRAAYAAIAAGVLTLIGGVLSGLVNKDSPSVYALDAVRDAAGQPVPNGGLLTGNVLFIHDHTVGLIGATVAAALGTALTALVLSYLFRAAQARKPDVPRIALYAALGGPIVIAISQVALVIVLTSRASTFASAGDHGTAAAHKALQSGAVNGIQLLSQVSLLAVALAFVLVSLNAMRVGLLTRFLGVLGVIVGGLPILGQFLGLASPLVQVFWLAAVGLVILGRRSTPLPAWDTGVAVPWPTKQQLNEQRERAARGEMTGPAPVPDVADKPTHSASKKKKRKRR
jgi:hypothetical protein